MPPPKALLFDLDGTLAETDSLHFPLWAELLGSHGLQVDWKFYQERVSGRLNPDIVAELLPHVPEPEADLLLQHKEDEFRRRAAELEPLPGLMRVLEESGRLGLATALVTNAPEENAHAMTRALGLRDFFDVEVLAGTLSAGKPDPLAYSTALHRLGVAAEEALAFEDSSSGIASAVGAGIRTVGIASTHDPEALFAAGASHAYPDFDSQELREIIFG
jgi:HAD superfamily hydrolase (TIGR01509 family)